MANGYEREVTRHVIGSCGVARSIIAGFHPADPGSNPGTSTKIHFVRFLNVTYTYFYSNPIIKGVPMLSQMQFVIQYEDAMQLPAGELVNVFEKLIFIRITEISDGSRFYSSTPHS